MTQAIEHLKKHHASKAFSRYMQTAGVREYKHFANLPDKYAPTLADAAMALHESIGMRACQAIGFSCDCGGVVVADGIAIGRSKLAQGKATKGITIAMWLEDVGQLGFVTKHVREEMDEALWTGWFDSNVTHLIDTKLIQKNHQRSVLEYQQRKTSVLSPSWYRRLCYWFTNLLIKRHYAKHEKQLCGPQKHLVDNPTTDGCTQIDI